MHSVVPVEGGLEFRAPFCSKRIHWFEITDAYELRTVENNFKFYQVDCNNGERFLLSDRLINSNVLVELIDGKISGVVRKNFELYWFVLFLSKKEPVAQRLLEHTEKLLSAKHRITS